MKTLMYTIIAFWLFTLTCTIYIARKHNVQKVVHHSVFIWNDDEESIPVDGSKIVIEKTINDTIYLGPMPTP